MAAGVGGQWGVLLKGYRVSVQGDENIYQQIMVIVAQQCECH